MRASNRGSPKSLFALSHNMNNLKRKAKRFATWANRCPLIRFGKSAGDGNGGGRNCRCVKRSRGQQATPTWLIAADTGSRRSNIQFTDSRLMFDYFQMAQIRQCVRSPGERNTGNCGYGSTRGTVVGSINKSWWQKLPNQLILMLSRCRNSCLTYSWGFLLPLFLLVNH